MAYDPERASDPEKQALSEEVNTAVFDFFQFLAQPEQTAATARAFERWRNNRPQFRGFNDFEQQAEEVYGVDPTDEFSELPDMASMIAEESPEQHQRALALEEILRKLHGHTINFRFNWKSPDDELERVNVLDHSLECGDSTLGWGVHLKVHDPKQDEAFRQALPDQPDYKSEFFIRMNDVYEFQVV